MTLKILFHGSGKRITSKHLKAHSASDNSSTDNNLQGVYATDDKDIAIGMSLTTEKYTKSFADYSKKPFQIVFVRGQPKKRFVYVYTVPVKDFVERPKGSHQWISKNDVQIIKREKLLINTLSSFWRKASTKEKKWYYNIKKKS